MARTVRQVIVALEHAGWQQMRQKGSHQQFRHPFRPEIVTVPGKPSDTLRPGTLANIRRKSGLEDLR